MRILPSPIDGRGPAAHLVNMASDPVFSPQSGDPSFPLLVRNYAEVLFMVAASTLVGMLMVPRWGNGAVDLLYLPPVLAAASFYGLRPALLAAVASVLAYNFFFTVPIHSFRVDRPSDLVTVAILLLVAVVTSQLAARMRRQASIAAANASRNSTIAGLARRLLSCSTEREIGEVACSVLNSLFGCNAVLVASRGEGVEVLAREPAGSPLTPSDILAATLTLETGEPAGRGAPRLDPAEWLFHPVRSERQAHAAMGLARDDGRTAVPESGLPLLGNLLDQTALALERSALEQEVRGVEALRERDRLRGALLSSVGHDLRTPLTAIIGAAAELRRAPGDEELVGSIETEGAKLERYISNLLDMARIEAGAIGLKDEPVDLVDSVSAALRDLRQALAGRQVEVELPPDLPLVRADPHLLHHCLINLVDNAASHSGPGERVRIAGEHGPEGVALSVLDEGPGLPRPDGEMFDTFVRISGSDRKGGAGLGLAIVKSFAEAMGVGVLARNREEGRGAAFTLLFPPALAMNEPGIG